VNKVYVWAAVAVVAIGGVFGFQHYKKGAAIEAVTPMVKSVSLRVGNMIAANTDPNSAMTFKEMFDKLEADIREVDNQILAVQTIETDGNMEITRPAIEYMKAGQDLLRQALNLSRKQLAKKTAEKWADSQVEEARTADGYSRDFAAKSARKAIKDWEKAMEEHKAAMTEARETANRFTAQIAKARGTFPAHAIIEEKVVKSLLGEEPEKAK